MAAAPTQSSTVGLLATGALVVICALAAGARPGAGWHSPDTRYRMQTDAFFRGTFALQPVPHGQQADWAWGNGSQQVWGLGVPFLRMPGEVVARIAGQQTFPDRITLIALFALVVSLAMRAPSGSAAANLPRLTLTIVIALLPAFVTLLRTRMFVYEEAVAYAYLWAALQLVLVIGIASGKPERWTYAAAAVAGFGAFIRPTLIFYGLATMAAIVMTKWQRPKVIAAAAALFAALIALILWTNVARFGDPLEFGQRVNASRWVLDQYAKNFDYPYAHEPLVSAGRELAAAIAAKPRFNGHEFYAPGPSMHQWFSATVRFREIYFTTGLSLFLLPALAGWWFGTPRRQADASHVIPALWSLAALAMLIAFYIRMPTTTSRYVVDLAAAIAGGVATVVLWLHANDDWRRKYRVATSVAIILAVCVGNLTASISPTHAASPLLSSAAAARATRVAVTSGPPIPSSYRCGDRIDLVGVPFNGVGWNWSGDCLVDAGTTLFMSVPDDRACIAIELDGASNVDTHAIEVKLGSTFLERHDATLQFCAPASFRRQPSGIEIASFKWVNVTELRDGHNLKSVKVISIHASSQK